MRIGEFPTIPGIRRRETSLWVSVELLSLESPLANGPLWLEVNLEIYNLIGSGIFALVYQGELDIELPSLSQY